MKNNNILLFGYLGCLPSVMVGIIEFMVHFTTESYESTITFGYLLNDVLNIDD